MAINLTKGQTIDLRKNDQGATFDLSTVTIGLGWDIRKKTSGGFFASLFGGGNQDDFDLDAMAFLLDENGKIADLGKTIQTNNNRSVGFVEGDIIFYNAKRHTSGNIWLTGDNRTGDGNGDDEQVIVKLDSLNEKYKKIVFLATIYQGKQKNQHFSMVSNAYIRAVDAKGKEITRFSLSGDESLNGMSTMIFAEAYRREGEWKFRALAEPKNTDLLPELLESYR